MNVLFPEILNDTSATLALGISKDVSNFAVFGKPIAHSKSPLMQNVALRRVADNFPRYKNSKYFAFEVSPDSLGSVLKNFWDANFEGINLTIPHKELAFSLLDDFDESARIACACNTLKRTASGWRGYNTDGFGLELALERTLDFKVNEAELVVIGAGGAARGAAAHLIWRGAKRVVLVNRSAERLEKLYDDLLRLAERVNPDVILEKFALSDDSFYSAIPQNSAIVNATSIGLKSEDLPVIDFSRTPKSCVFFDMPYRSGVWTNSVAEARKCGLCATSGLSMLAWQGAKSMSIWTGAELCKLGEAMCGALAPYVAEGGKL